jgi:hypothetical protein
MGTTQADSRLKSTHICDEIRDGTADVSRGSITRIELPEPPRKESDLAWRRYWRNLEIHWDTGKWPYERNIVDESGVGAEWARLALFVCLFVVFNARGPSASGLAQPPEGHGAC